MPPVPRGRAAQRARRVQIAAEVERLGGTPGSVAAVAERFGVTPATVRNSCREHRVAYARAVGKLPSTGSFRVIAELCNTDDTYARIAARHGVTPQCVQQIHARCVRAKIPVRKRGKGT